MLSHVEGSIIAEGLTTISIKGGVIEKLEEETIITTGKHLGIVPVKVLRAFKIEEAGAIRKVIRLTVSEVTVIAGKVPVRLTAFTKGWLFEPSRLVDDAIFEVTMPRLGISKIYRNNETAFLFEGEDVKILVTASDYVSEWREVRITKDLQVITFHLRAKNPPPWIQIQEWIAGVLTNRYFIPIALGVIVTLLIIVLVRRK